MSGRVELLQWPRDAERRAALVADGVPRLLVLGPGASPPPLRDLLEDWVMSTADELEVSRRLQALAERGSGPAGTVLAFVGWRR